MLGGLAGWIAGAQRGQGKGELDTLEALFMEPRQKEKEAQLQVEMESWGPEVSRGQQQLLPAHLPGFPPPFTQPQCPNQSWKDPRASGSALTGAWCF